MRCYILFILLLAIACTSEPKTEPIEQQEQQRVIQQPATKQYTDALEPNNRKLRETAANLTRECGNNRYCQLIKLFNYVQQNQYLSDPVGNELVQDPAYTLHIRSGDCEDLAILYVSLLRNIGIQSHLVIMDGHMLTAVCGVDTDDYIQQLFEISPNVFGYRNHEKLIEQKGYYFLTAMNDYSIYPLNVELITSKPVDVTVYKNRDEHMQLLEGKPSAPYMICDEYNVTETQMECELEKGNVLNISTKEPNTHIKLRTHLSKEYLLNQLITTEHNNQACLYVDPTYFGDLVFPGLLSENTRNAEKTLLPQ